jgi:hypothetical protein
MNISLIKRQIIESSRAIGDTQRSNDTVVSGQPSLFCHI